MLNTHSANSTKWPLHKVSTEVDCLHSMILWYLSPKAPQHHSQPYAKTYAETYAFDKLMTIYAI